MPHDPLQDLEIFDPELISRIRAALESVPVILPPGMLERIAEDILWAFAQEENFGVAFATGILQLLNAGRPEPLQRYRKLVRSKGAGSATVGRLLALHLPPALLCTDSRMSQRMLEAVTVLEKKGTYTLQRPLEAVASLLESGDTDAAASLLRLLSAVYSQELSYSRSQHLALKLPRAALQMPSAGRPAQLEQLARVAAEDHRLVDPLLEGLEKGLHLLSDAALERFVTRTLQTMPADRNRLERLLSLSLQQARDWSLELQVAVPLDQIRGRLNQYLRARTGLPLTVACIPKNSASEDIAAYSDGRHIYLPERIERFADPEANRQLYRCLARFESGCYEFGTFEFDCRRALDRCREEPQCAFLQDAPASDPDGIDPDRLSDLNVWFSRFPHPRLAEDLFHVFEHGRIRRLFSMRYPGLVRTYLPILQREWHDRFADPSRTDPLNGLYAAVALAIPLEDAMSPTANRALAMLQPLADRLEALSGDCLGCAEDAAVLAACAYGRPWSGHAAPEAFFFRRLQIPFGRRLRPDLFFTANLQVEKKARALQARLSDWGISLYRGTVRRHLWQTGGRMDRDALAELVKASGQAPSAHGFPDARDLAARIAAELGMEAADSPADTESSGPAWRYPEWDCRLADYLQEHTQVRECRLEGAESEQSNDYEAALDRYRGLVQTVRRAFEMLRPQGLKLYRRWVEGDEFDYRALIDYRVDRRARRTPSEKIYIKRVKEARDVAVLLLVDLSRSTANYAIGSAATVLDVEKDAIVLFTQALETVGDAYAVAGFSGTGPLGVDYYRIKNFDEALDDRVRRRIAAMAAFRNTRMGAAIRHAAAQFSAVSARVRLLILLGDGFPNDLDYKHDYAVADTRKAISELRAEGIYVHAITVNINADPRLDELYGDIHHSVIAEVRDLPDRMWRIYGALTR